MSRGSRRWQEPQNRKKKKSKVKVCIPSFPISKYFGLYLMVKDVGSQKVNITIEQLVTMVLLTRRELRKGLSTLKVPKVPTPLNAIAT
jgi:hypothetical protein